MNAPPMEDLSFDLASLHAAFARGVTAAEVIAEVYRRIAAADDPGIFLHLVPAETALAEATALGPCDLERMPLWGVPFAVKDNIDMAGVPTTAACPAFAYQASADAFVVAALRRAGAIPIGKTNLDQFAAGLVGVRSPHQPPKNALDPEIVPGGSSSGSAVAVARGLVSFALGTDTAGSGRVPAALNNIVGLKPTLGALSSSGVVPACRTLDTVSVFALTVPDAYAVFRAAAEFDPDDAYARRVRISDLGPLPPAFTVGVPDPATRTFCGDKAQEASFDATIDAIEALGGGIVEIDFRPFFAAARMLYEGPWVAERYTVVEDLIRERPEALHPVTRRIIGAGGGYTAADVFRGQYRLQALKREAERATEDVDLLCVPSVPTFYTLAELAADPVGPNARLGTYTNFVNLMDLCGIAVPVAPRGDGRPGGVTLLAPAGRDAQAAGLADALHRRSGVPLGATGREQPPAVDAQTVRSDEIALAVVGAHMSGLPLNGELARLGARFLSAGRTAPGYRLYRLAGPPPMRPGLVRDGGNASIELEVWAVPADRIGDFLSGISQPLGIGTLVLDDGGSVKGFLCETAGLDGAEDITDFGGWRRYLASVEQDRPASVAVSI